MRQLIALSLTSLLMAAGNDELAKKKKQDETRPPRPETVEPEKRLPADSSHDFVRFAFNFYNQDDGGGNPNVDESTIILEPMILFSKGIGEKLVLTLKLQGDFVGDPFAGLGEGGGGEDEDEDGGGGGGANARTGASAGSGTTEQYYRVDGGAFYAWSDQIKAGAGFSYSQESDYQSTGGYVKGSYETPSHNDAFSIRLGGYFDQVRLKFFDGSSGGTDRRQTTSIGIGYSRVLTAKTIASISWDVTLQEGFLATASNSVFIGDNEVREVLPESRARHAFHGRIRHLVMPDLAVEPGIGYYFDDWGAIAFNVEISLFWEVIPNTLIIRPSFRYHDQTAVDYFVPTAAGPVPTHRTQDSDLGSFDSQTIGMKFVWPTGLGDNTEFEFGGDFTRRSDGLEWFSFSIGFQWRF